MISLPSTWHIGRKLPPAGAVDPRPDWQQADVRWIRGALERARALPSGGWYVLDASRSFGRKPRCMQVEGRNLVIWRDADGSLLAAPNACPHLGAALDQGIKLACCRKPGGQG